MYILILLRHLHLLRPYQTIARGLLSKIWGIYKQIRCILGLCQSPNDSGSSTIARDQGSPKDLKGYSSEDTTSNLGSGSIICTSQLPPTVGYRREYPLPAIPEDRNIAQSTSSETQSVIQPHIDRLSHDPPSAASLPRPTTGIDLFRSHSQQQWSSSRPLSRASLRSRTSIRTTGHDRALLPARTLRATHVTFGVSTGISIVRPLVPEAILVVSPSQHSHDSSSSDAESRTMHPIVSTERYDRDVVMFVFNEYCF